MDRSPAAAVADTVERARWAEAAGYHRFRVAEHHAVPGIASGSPAVLLAAVGAATHDIGLGTAGIMLPNHTPLLVAENALMLDALFPGRVDLGIGRSLGFTPPIRRALRTDTADGFADDLAELLAFLDGTGPVTAQPAAHRPIPVSVLATGSGLEVAARLGLPVVVGGPALADPDRLRTYRRTFVPTATTPRPRVTVSADILVADTDADARVLALSEAVAMAESRRTGDFPRCGRSPRCRSSDREHSRWPSARWRVRCSAAARRFGASSRAWSSAPTRTRSCPRPPPSIAQHSGLPTTP
ncbi:MsnO8 family LLM class oxidoreductase [Rhodococcoides kroppenstedtii]|uniref:MsnO8 family LLM class oxidoreductase n=1 Tax=Rhodococcoides kroppenstedtii TaxID=293050 RepID=UPI003139F24B